MLFHIAYQTRETPFGGGNQFLKALKKSFIEKKCYTDDIHSADIVLFNSFFFSEIPLFDFSYTLKKQFKNKYFLHRLDGLISQTRNDPSQDYLDKISSLWAEIFVDGAIFQSDFCQNRQQTTFYPTGICSTVIPNASDESVFYPSGPRPKKLELPIQLVYTSWSSNMRKGFATLAKLDEQLDFSRFTMTFIGNSPIPFTNIRTIAPQDSKTLGDSLRQADIFLGVSHDEPCSNAIGEALACGLPALIRNEGGNPSFVHQGAVLYDSDDEIPQQLENIVEKFESYRQNVSPANINDIANQYIAFAEKIANSPPKKPNAKKFLTLRKEIRKHFPEVPRNLPWQFKLWLEGLCQ